jgi:hypothetical protein
MRDHCIWPEPPMDLFLDFAQVLSDMATFMWHTGLLAQGIDALRTAEHILGVKFRDEAMSRRHKAIEARTASHRLIESCCKVVGPS